MYRVPVRHGWSREEREHIKEDFIECFNIVGRGFYSFLKLIKKMMWGGLICIHEAIILFLLKRLYSPLGIPQQAKR